MAFSATFEAAGSDSHYSLQGDITGSTQVTVIGLCTRHKALELARDEIVGVTQDYFEEQLRSESW